MKIFKVRITEILEKEFEIEAEDEAEALSKVHESYINAEDDYILDYNDYQGFEMEIAK